jgi:hypothetical protein
MKVLVVWEDPRERDEAENLAEVLQSMSPTLAGARLDDHGGVSIIHAGQKLPKVAVQCGNWTDHMDAFTRAMLKVP